MKSITRINVIILFLTRSLLSRYCMNISVDILGIICKSLGLFLRQKTVLDSHICVSCNSA